MMADGRDPKPCPKCGEVCRYDGWGHVHAAGVGIGSCQGWAPVNNPAYDPTLVRIETTDVGHDGSVTRTTEYVRAEDFPARWFGVTTDEAIEGARRFGEMLRDAPKWPSRNEDE